jgi:hypothetical protein
MATANIRIDQPTNDPQIGVIGRSRDDIIGGITVNLRNADDTGVRSWRWTMVDRPGGSSAGLSDPTNAAPSFIPDEFGTYLIQLIVNEGRTGEVDRIVVAVRDELGLRVPAAGEINEANWLIDGSPNHRGYQPEFERFRAALNNLSTSVESLDRPVVYEIDFRELDSETIEDGEVRLGLIDWEAANVDNASTFEIVETEGIRITHDNGVDTEISDSNNAPQLRIQLENLIPDYDPTHRYMFLVHYEWAVEPDDSSERFSIGFQSFSGVPFGGTPAIFRGATSVLQEEAGLSHEAESNNQVSNVGAPTLDIMGVYLCDGKIIETYQADPSDEESWPTLAELVPVANQRTADAEPTGEACLTHPETWFTMALASAVMTGVHSVTIIGLRIVRMV